MSGIGKNSYPNLIIMTPMNAIFAMFAHFIYEYMIIAPTGAFPNESSYIFHIGADYAAQPRLQTQEDRTMRGSRPSPPRQHELRGSSM